jgi:hypothetical protein
MRHYGLWLDRYEMRRAQILQNWSGFAKSVGELKSKIPQETLFHPLRKSIDLDSKMCFIDGGEGIRELLGLGIYFIRASGLMLCSRQNAESGELFIRDLDMNMISYDDHVKDRVDLLRDGMEYDIAIRCAKEHKPKIIFLDGSLHVKAGRRPVDCVEYEYYRKKLNRLFRICKRDDIRLIGVSEDSRSRLLSHHLSEEYGVEFPRHMTDSTILKILSTDGGYMTCEFMPRYGLERSGCEIGETPHGFKTAYMQPTRTANPLRIDAPEWEEDFEGAIGIIASLCKGSGHYGYPIPLYMAHLDARINTAQMDWTVKQMSTYLSKKDKILADSVVKPTRRFDRPN